MPDLKISQLTSYSTPVSTDVLAIVDTGNSQTKKVTVAALLSVAGMSVVTKKGNYTLVVSDSVILADTTAGGFTLTLPNAATCSGKSFTIKKIDNSGHVVVVATFGSQTIDGLSSASIATSETALRIVSSGANWFIL